MGKPKMLKEETVNRIKKLAKKYSIDEIWNTKEFISLSTHYVNTYERERLAEIVTLSYDGKSYDEIRFILNKGEIIMSKQKTKNIKPANKEEMDPVEQEAVFMISQQKVVEVDEPVEVKVGEPEIEETNHIESEVQNEVFDETDTNADTNDSVFMISQQRVIEQGQEKPTEVEKSVETDLHTDNPKHESEKFTFSSCINRKKSAIAIVELEMKQIEDADNKFLRSIREECKKEEMKKREEEIKAYKEAKKDKNKSA